MLKALYSSRASKGFTLMEMLIVVAIIAILVAIAIPVFSNQLEKVREATDAANIRAAYAEALMKYIGAEDESFPVSAESQVILQTKAGWDYIKGSIGGLIPPSVTAGNTVWVAVDEAGRVAFAASNTPGSEPTSFNFGS